jgi:hypothetical protein
MKLKQGTKEFLAIAGNRFAEMSVYDFSTCIENHNLLICDTGLPVLSSIRNSGCLAHIYAKRKTEIR